MKINSTFEIDKDTRVDAYMESRQNGCYSLSILLTKNDKSDWIVKNYNFQGANPFWKSSYKPESSFGSPIFELSLISRDTNGKEVTELCMDLFTESAIGTVKFKFGSVEKFSLR